MHAGRRIPFTKGHGTENDFVVLADLDGDLDPTPDQVRALCDRRAGIGADGVLRVVRTADVAQAESYDATASEWFMDYRNADGSVAEMCGNGVRVFVRYLIERGLADGPEVPVGTRNGVKEAVALADGRIRVAMGPTVVLGRDVTVQVAGSEQSAAAYRVDVGNPHAVTFVRSDALDGLDLHRAPRWEPAEVFPHGANVEFVAPRGQRHIAMRVFERGSGDPLLWHRHLRRGRGGRRATRQPRPVSYLVDVPGGQVEVELTDEQTYLTGPAELVADGEFILRV